MSNKETYFEMLDWCYDCNRSYMLIHDNNDKLFCKKCGGYKVGRAKVKVQYYDAWGGAIREIIQVDGVNCSPIKYFNS